MRPEALTKLREKGIRTIWELNGHQGDEAIAGAQGLLATLKNNPSFIRLSEIRDRMSQCAGGTAYCQPGDKNAHKVPAQKVPGTISSQTVPGTINDQGPLSGAATQP